MDVRRRVWPALVVFPLIYVAVVLAFAGPEILAMLTPGALSGYRRRAVELSLGILTLLAGSALLSHGVALALVWHWARKASPRRLVVLEAASATLALLGTALALGPLHRMVNGVNPREGDYFFFAAPLVVPALATFTAYALGIMAGERGKCIAPAA